MRKPSLLLLLLIAQTVIAQRTQAQTWQDTVKTIESLFARYQPDAPGCELAISRNGQLIYSKAWGLADLEHHIDYIHFNPLTAGLVTRLEEWPFSSASGKYELDPIPQGLKPLSCAPEIVGPKGPTPAANAKSVGA